MCIRDGSIRGMMDACSGVLFLYGSGAISCSPGVVLVEPGEPKRRAGYQFARGWSHRVGLGFVDYGHELVSAFS